MIIYAVNIKQTDLTDMSMGPLDQRHKNDHIVIYIGIYKYSNIFRSSIEGTISIRNINWNAKVISNNYYFLLFVCFFFFVCSLLLLLCLVCTPFEWNSVEYYSDFVAFLFFTFFTYTYTRARARIIHILITYAFSG